MHLIIKEPEHVMGMRERLCVPWIAGMVWKTLT